MYRVDSLTYILLFLKINMLDLAFKNIMRQKTRTSLTVLGILIGIAAIVALGSIAEGIDAAVQGGLELTAGKIMIMETGGVYGLGGSLDNEDLEEIESVNGIKDIIPMIFYTEMRKKSTLNVLIWSVGRFCLMEGIDRMKQDERRTSN